MSGVLVKSEPVRVTLYLPKSYVEAIDRIEGTERLLPEEQRRIKDPNRSRIMRIALARLFRSLGESVNPEDLEEDELPMS